MSEEHKYVNFMNTIIIPLGVGKLVQLKRNIFIQNSLHLKQRFIKSIFSVQKGSDS